MGLLFRCLEVEKMSLRENDYELENAEKNNSLPDKFQSDKKYRRDYFTYFTYIFTNVKILISVF